MCAAALRLLSILHQPLHVCVYMCAAVVPSPAVRYPCGRVRLQERALWRLWFSRGRFLCRLTSDWDHIQGPCSSLVVFICVFLFTVLVC